MLRHLSEAFHLPGITPRQRCVLMVIADCADDDGIAVLEWDTIKSRVEISGEKARRAVLSLSEMGVLSWESVDFGVDKYNLSIGGAL
jgi:hypothetical protein